MATLYRNFAGRRELLEALYTDEVDAVCAAAADARGATPGAAFEAWLRRFFVFYSAKHHVGQLLLDAEGETPFFSAGRARVLAAAAPLLHAAQDAGEVRDDVTIEQALDLVVAVGRIGGDAAYLEPILRAALDGLRRHPRREMPS